MQEFIFKTWNSVMSAKHNPLRHIPDDNVRHLIMQMLAWMWAIMFSAWMGSLWVFGISVIAHTALIAAITITVVTFKVAKHKPDVFIRKK